MPRNDADSYYFRFFPDKYLGGTAGFSFEMHGAYLILLLNQWQHGPFDEDFAVSIIGDLWTKIRHKFIKTDAGYVNVRMEEESQHKKKISESRTNAVLTRYKRSTNVVQLNNKCSTNVLQPDMICYDSLKREEGCGGKPKKKDSGSESEVEKKEKKAKFVPPSIEEVKAYIKESGITFVDSEYFHNYYTANGWKVSGRSMVDWKATVRNWNIRERKNRNIPPEAMIW